MTKIRFKEIEKDIEAHLTQEQILAKWGVSQLKDFCNQLERSRGAARGRIMAVRRKIAEQNDEREHLLSERGGVRASDLWPICENKLAIENEG